MNKQVSMLYFQLDFKKALNPLLPLMNWWHGRLFRTEALSYINSAIEDDTQIKDRKTIVGLAYKSQQAQKGPDGSAPPPLNLENLVNHVKMFMFAGHDSTAVTLAYIYYNMILKPDVLASVRKEHEEVFGPDPLKVHEQLLADPSLLNKLPYTFCVIKETLRLYPPFGGTVRTAPEDFQLVHESGKRLPVHGFMIFPAGSRTAKDPKYFRNPMEYLPERWMESSPEANTTFPPLVTKSAWRPFEMGPRNCIGQELVYIELKMVMALTLREFNFEAMYKDDAPTWWGNPGYQCAVPEHPVSARIKDRLPVRITTVV